MAVPQFDIEAVETRTKSEGSNGGGVPSAFTEAVRESFTKAGGEPYAGKRTVKWTYADHADTFDALTTEYTTPPTNRADATRLAGNRVTSGLREVYGEHNYRSARRWHTVNVDGVTYVVGLELTARHATEAERAQSEAAAAKRKAKRTK